ncbi:TorF family putative porin [Hyphomicrobium sp. CS1GBMeth3]|uniref:TorF family putative porin n=1 Tax=Hyphomicrobium sp. CS1GBMeth3 TaxID=1892845 RepID=UPI000931B031|nr:TorF family putative porin [Hyphomicrobium sp. CS1GBMeth3]
MSRLTETVRLLLVGTALTALSSAALADGYGDSVKDTLAAEGRKLDLSITLGATSDYVFRGISQTDEDPAAQGSVDLTYGIFYAGIWASNVDFSDGSGANAEVDFYAGFKPTLGPGPFWGPITFDLGVIYYAYPGARSSADLDYVELKAGYSMESPWIKGLTTGTTLYWTPENTGDTGEVFTLESAASYALPQIGIFSPSVSGAYGTVYGDSDDGFNFGGDDEYSYWNAGLALAVEKFTFDFRYWDTDISGGLGGLADERFVFTAKVTLP